MIEHLLSMEDLDEGAITVILDTAEGFKDLVDKPIKKVPVLRGRTVCNLFYEDSTARASASRSRRSACRPTSSTSRAKGSSRVARASRFKDTALTLQAMGVDAIVVRHSASGAPQRLTQWVDAKVLNAGDGAHQHPTQALLDLFTIRERFGKLDGLHVAVVRRRGAQPGGAEPRAGARDDGRRGDARRAADAAARRGAKRGVQPSSYDLDTVLPDLTCCYLLRVQHERMEEQFFPSPREYARIWGVDARRLARLPSGAIVMHPGPMNRGMEITADVADAPNTPDPRPGDERDRGADELPVPDARRRGGRAVTAVHAQRRAVVDPASGTGRGHQRGGRRRGRRRRSAGSARARRRGRRPGLRAGLGRPARPPARAGRRGRRDGRDRHRGGGGRRVHRGLPDGQHQPGDGPRRRRRAGPAPGARGRPLRRLPRRRDHQGPARARSSPRSARWPRSACAASPTTACRSPPPR